MDFHKFPVDEQYCEVKFESFGFSSKQVNIDQSLTLQIFILLVPHAGADEVDGPGSLQREHQHLPGPVLLLCSPDGLLQHGLL